MKFICTFCGLKKELDMRYGINKLNFNDGEYSSYCSKGEEVKQMVQYQDVSLTKKQKKGMLSLIDKHNLSK